MELLLIRHGLPVRRELNEGPADPELSDHGIAQAQCLADYLANERIDALYASPLRRARQTAEPIAISQQLTLLIDDDVAEYDRSSSEYIPMEVLKAANDPRWHALVRGEAEHEADAESFSARAIGAVERLIAAHHGARIAVVCHGGIITTYLGHILGLTNSINLFYPNYTSIHRVAAARSGERTLVTVNETSHLRGTGLPMGIFQGPKEST